MFDSIIHGFLIGLFTSAPVGPIAIVIIQRSLQKGRRHGFFSGLGAATSDFIYALMALGGLSFVMNFIQKNELYIQIGGSLVIMIFGIFLFLKKPNLRQLRQNDEQNTYSQEYFTTLLLTITNPMMIFLFLGLFARFDFLAERASFIDVFFGMVSVFAGSCSWWFLLTQIASKFKRFFNIRGLVMLNKITGSVIFALALGGLILTAVGVSLSSL